MKKKLTFNKILLSIALVISLGIIAASAVFLCTKNAVPGAGLRKIESESLLQKNNAAFDLIGLQRITTKIDKDQIRHVPRSGSPPVLHEGAPVSFPDRCR